MRHDVKCVESWGALDAVGGDPAVRARWLERALAGLDLQDVITELAALSGGPANLAEVPPELVRSWLGPDAAAVLQQGLVGLPRRKLDELFRRPGLLVGLQELVFTEGGPHWNDIVRQNDAMNIVVKSHRDPVLGRLGLTPPSPRRNVAPTGQHVSPGKPAGTGSTLPREPSVPERRPWQWPLFVMGPLAAAAAVLVAVLSSRWRQPEEQPGPGRERVVIVKAVVPIEEGDQPEFEIAPGQPWPAHPWQGMTVPQTKPMAAVNSDLLDTLAGAQAWSRRLRGARNLSAAQVRDALERARDAVAVIEALVESGGIGFNDDGRTLLGATCRAAQARLSDLEAKMADDAVPDGGVAEAQADVARVLTDIEEILSETCSPPAPEPVNPGPDAASPIVDEGV